jgi:hypothetical protein
MAIVILYLMDGFRITRYSVASSDSIDAFSFLSRFGKRLREKAE